MKLINLLGLVPVIYIIIGSFAANRVTPYIWGMPFILFYFLLCLPLVSIILAIIFKFSRKEGDEY